MAIGKISGVMLQNNLSRQGVDLTIDGNLTYFDVSNRRIGINTTPTQDLDVPGNVRLASLSILGNLITSNTGKIGLGSISNVVITGGSANYILSTDGSGVLSFIDGNTSPAIIAITDNLAGLTSNAATQATSINSTNANVGTLHLGNISTNANLGAYQIYANANAATQQTSIDSINANVTAANLSIVSLRGNNITLGSNTSPSLSSNAVILTTSTTVTDAVAQLNFVLGKLVPPSPPTFPGTSTLTLSTSVSTGRITDFVQTDNSGWANLSVAAGTSVSATRVATYAAGTITTVGPGNSGTVTAYRNGVAAGTVTMNTGSQNGTYSNLIIASDQDYSAVIGGSGGFWESFNASLSGSSVPAGWNRANIVHTSGNPTNTITWYYDSASPGTPTFSNTSIALNSNTVSYSSTVPHFTSSTTFTIKGNVAKLSGDTYPVAVTSGSSTLVTGSSATGFQTPTAVTYTAAGVTVPLTRSLYVSAGSAYFETTSAIATGFGSTTTGPGLSVTNNYLTGTSGALIVSGTPTILYKTGTSTNIEETSIPVTSVGVGSGNGLRIANPGSSDNSAYTGSEAAFNSTTGPFYTYDATNIGSSGQGIIKFDQTNYSTGYLPVGPNLSGQGASQYFTFKFTRTTVQRFDVVYTGTIAGLWVALPGSAIDTTASPTSGWLNMATAYAGSGVPGTGAGGNGSAGCAFGGVAVLNSSGTRSITANFGTVQSGSSGTNAGDIYVRIKLTSGQSLTALSIVTATH